MAGRLPNGVITFVFTDIEGSTVLLRRAPAAYASVLIRHHELLDQAMSAEGGVRMSDEGDGAYFVFQSASAAVRAASSAQAALAAEPWPDDVTVRVRMGMHSGEATLTDDRRYVGLAVHLAARIAAAGHGGQVLLSSATHEQARHEITPETRDLGVHTFADFPDPIRIVQLGTEAFAPLRTAGRRSLPVPIGELFGREEECTRVSELLRDHRLVTILGPGGTGKSRLAVELARSHQAAGRPVTFVDLTTISDSRFTATLMSAELGLAETPDADSLGRIAQILDRTRTLVVLDNCEHLLPGIGEVTRNLATRAEHARFLATSRSPLGVTGEHRFDLSGLAIEGPAAELFRARANEAGVVLGSDEATRRAIADVCAALDGLPLALELAASLSAVTPVQRLSPMLKERLDLLGAGASSSDRHRTLTATLEWAVDTLTPKERTAFEHLGVMVGPFDLDDAAAILDIDAFEAVRVMATLCDRSLVKRRDDGAFSLLETVRWFARRALTTSRDLDALEARHRAHFGAVARDARSAARSDGGAETLDRVWRHRSNLLAAMDFAVGQGDADGALEILEGLVDLWGLRAAGREARMKTDQVAAAFERSGPRQRARALLAQLEVRQAAGVGKGADPELADRLARATAAIEDEVLRYQAVVWQAGAGTIPLEDAEVVLTELRRLGDHRSWTIAAETVAWAWWWRSQQQRSFEIFHRILSEARTHHDVVAQLTAGAGVIAAARTPEQVETAMAIGDEMDPVAARLGAAWWQALRFQWMAGPWYHGEGTGAGALAWLDRAYRLAADRGTTDQLAFVVADQTVRSWDRGEVGMAHAKLIEFAETYIGAGDSPMNPFFPEMGAAIAAEWRAPEAAARLLGAAEHWRAPGTVTDQGMPMPEWDRSRHATTVARSVADLGRPRFERLVHEGASMTLDDVLDLVFGLSRPPGHAASESTES